MMRKILVYIKKDLYIRKSILIQQVIKKGRKWSYIYQ